MEQNDTKINEMTELDHRKKNEELAVLSKIIVNGDLTPLNPQELVTYYKAVCESNGLNPSTKPFELIRFQGKTILYARKDATDQLRAVHGISIRITGREKHDDLYIVTAQAINKHGRHDESVGAMNLAGLKGDALANAIMKAETKAKRRVTLSIAGLGFLDESEGSSIPGAKTFDFNMETGEIIGLNKAEQPIQAPTALLSKTNEIEIKQLAQSIIDRHAEDDKLGGLSVLLALSNEDKYNLKKYLSKDTKLWLQQISQNPPTAEQCATV